MGEQNYTDKEKIEMVIDSLGLNANAFSDRLGYKTPNSVYHIIKERNNLSLGMMERIVSTFKNVNYNFLKFGDLPVILEAEDMQNQMNILNITEDPEYSLFKKLMTIPDRLESIENLLKQIVDKNHSGVQ